MANIKCSDALILECLKLGKTQSWIVDNFPTTPPRVRSIKIEHGFPVRDNAPIKLTDGQILYLLRNNVSITDIIKKGTSNTRIEKIKNKRTKKIGQ